MTMSKALKTGLMVKGEHREHDCNIDYRPKSAGDFDATLFFRENQNLVSISAYPGLATAEGIKLGSSVSALKKAYKNSEPSWDVATGPEGLGRAHAPVPGNSEAVYRIAVEDGKVSEINLQLTDEGCYE